MQRELKFRAWDIKNNQMIDWNTLTQSVWNNNSAQLLYSVMVLLKPNYILQQFTGLQDKNKKEIYEGDIVKVKGTKKVGVYTTEIIWHRSGFKLLENKTYLMDFYITKSMVEIIGNIYENPELLNN